MRRAHVVMAYQACEVAELAAAAVTVDDPEEAVVVAGRVLAAAQQLVAAAQLVADDNALDGGPAPADPLQRFAYEHPDEAAADINDWLRRCRSHEDQAGAHAPADG